MLTEVGLSATTSTLVLQAKKGKTEHTGVSQKQQVIQERVEQKGCEEGWPGRQGMGGTQDYMKCLVICQCPGDLALCLQVSQVLLEPIPNRLPTWDDSRRLNYSTVHADFLNALPREPEAGFPHCRSPSSAFRLTPKNRAGSYYAVLRIHEWKNHRSPLRKQLIIFQQMYIKSSTGILKHYKTQPRYTMDYD